MNVCDRKRHVKIREEEYEVPCGSRYCPACGQRWMGDQRVQAVANSDELRGDVALLTITGPGRRAMQRMARDRGLSPKDAVRWWNGSARERWRGLHLEAAGPPRRWAKKQGVEWRMEYRVWEYQKRGVLHIHVVAPMHSPVARETTRRYVANLARASEWWGFGFVLGGDRQDEPRPRWVPPVVAVPAGKAARYVAKYVASTGPGKDNLVSTARRTAQRGSVLYITRKLTSVTGVNMTTLRARRRIYARYPWSRATERCWRAACVVDSVQRGRAPLTKESVARIIRAVWRTGDARWVDAGTGEVHAPTRAPMPRAAKPWTTEAARREGRVAFGLASVLVRDSHAPWLGPTRSRVEVVSG